MQSEILQNIEKTKLAPNSITASNHNHQPDKILDSNNNPQTEQLESCPPELIKSMIIRLLDDNRFPDAFEYIKQAKTLDKDIIWKLIEQNRAHILEEYLDKFSDLDNPDLDLVQELRNKKFNTLAAKIEEKMVYNQTIKGKFYKAKKTPKNQRTEAIEKFNKELSSYKKGWLEIKKNAINLIRKNPDIQKDKFLTWFNQEAQSVGFDTNPLEHKGKENSNIAIPSEITKVKKFFNNYRSKHYAVQEIREDFPDDILLFEYLYKRKPHGKIEIIDGIANLHIRCWDKADYTTIYINKAKITPEDIDKAVMSGGLKTKHEGITITAEKNDRGLDFKNKRAQEIFIHEEQHVINDIFQEGFTFNQKFNEALVDEDEEKIYEIIEKKLREYRKNEIETQTKDEVLAYFQEDEYSELYEDFLLQKKKEGGLYDYANPIKENPLKALEIIVGKDNLNETIFELEKSKIYNKIMLALSYYYIDEIFIHEYEKIVSKNILLVEKLEKKYGKEETIALLIDEPFSQWQKISKRIE